MDHKDGNELTAQEAYPDQLMASLFLRLGPPILPMSSTTRRLSLDTSRAGQESGSPQIIVRYPDTLPGMQAGAGAMQPHLPDIPLALVGYRLI